MLEEFLSLSSAAPDAVAVIEAEAQVTRGELLRRAQSIARELRDGGVAAGDIIAVRLPNSSAFVAAVLAGLMERLIIVPIDRDAPASEVESIARHFGMRAVIQMRDGARSISARRGSGKAALPEAARLLKLTSGSTGSPKAIVCSERTLDADAANICETMRITAGDLNIGAIPFSHSYGFSNLVTPLLRQGTAVVASNEYLPLSLLRLCNRHRCSIAPLIPMVFDHLAGLPLEDGRFESVRTFISAGAPLRAGTAKRFRERFGLDIHSFYGCSETGGITFDRPGAAAERGTVGAPMEHVRLDIDAATERLCIRSDAVAHGTFAEGKFTPFDGTFLADDLVSFSCNREVTLAGRATDVINTAGKKVNPREVEQVILQMPGVRDVRVYGEPAGARGEVVAAAVVGDGSVTREGIRDFCRLRLSAHKVPRIVKLPVAIPVDDRGKVKRAALEAL